MDKYLREHEQYISRVLTTAPPGLDWLALLAFHRAQVQFLQHERLVHLLVMLAFALFTLAALSAFLFLPSVTTGALAGILILLLAAYVIHYYKLENGVQRLYRLDRQLVARTGTLPPFTG
ncbi:MAG: hypothetical protein NTV33_00715 [Coprothermobacterota bacterium]|nr:hypothetical protein [Coprothermobacterota bacterium]